jgi:hypothetical protein
MINIVKWVLVGMGFFIVLIGLFLFPVYVVEGEQTIVQEKEPKPEPKKETDTATV